MPQPRAIILAIVSSGAQSTDDKASLPYQLREGHALAERIDAKIVTELAASFSRDYNNFDECERDMTASGIDAFARLRLLWEHKAFDVLICREGSRLGREQSILAEVIQRTIQMGASIHLTSGGIIDKANYRFMIAILGLASAKENDTRIEYRRMGADKTAQRGLPVGRIPLLSHVVVRDEYGHRQHVIRNEWLVPIMRDVAQLVLEGISWDRIEKVLYQRFGHVDRTGLPFRPRTFYRILLSPFFWGNNAHGGKHRQMGLWAFDDTVASPAIVKMFYNTHIPFWHDEEELPLSDSVKSELRRRHTVIKGRALPGSTRAFSGTMICDECGSMLAGCAERATYTYYRCIARYRPQGSSCTQTGTIRNDRIQKYLNDWLSQLLTNADFELLSEESDNAATQKLLNNLQKEISRLQIDLDKLINDKLEASSLAVQTSLTRRIEATGQRIDKATEQAAQLHRSLSSEEIQARKTALKEINEIGLADLWELPSRQINQLLHRFLGSWRLRVSFGEIKGRVRSTRKHRSGV